MMSALATFLSAVLLLAVNADELENSISFSEEDFSETGRIVGGENAEEGQFPFTAALYFDDEFVCTASIISPTSLLSAAHCVVTNGVTKPHDGFYAIIGSVDRTSPDAKKVFFRKIIAHKGYESAKTNDIAILQTSDPMEYGENVKPICIASPKIGKLLLKKVTAMGWGYTKEGSNDLPETLQYVSQRVVPNLKCSALYLFFLRVPGTVLCAHGLSSGICGGDSGGPLVYNAKSGPVQVGVNAFVNNVFGCGKYLGPAGFTRVSSYTDFIMDNATGDVCVSK